MQLPRLLLLCIAATAVLLFTGFRQTVVLTVAGSDTMLILAQRWADAYMSRHPGVSIHVSGGGTGTGIAALLAGTADICTASRPLSPEELRALKERFGTLGVEIPCAKDGLAIYVHRENPVRNLTLAQVRDIFTGRITNWKHVGGRDERIMLYARENNSGTNVYFREHVLNFREYSPACRIMPGTAALAAAVARDVNAVGYGGAAYGKDIREIAIDGIEPTAGHVRSGTYPITRFLAMVTRSKPTGELKRFIDWVLSDEGQAIVSDVGYFPVR